MKLISLNVSLPRIVEWHGEPVTTGIFKEPVDGPLMLRVLNLDGDRQADLTVHGGKSKAVYAYPSEHYPFWKDAYPWLEMPWGMLGENITTEGIDEHVINIGDQFRFGSSILMVKQPRMPCQKLAAKFAGADVGKRMIAGRRNGFYLSVVQEGEVVAGDSIELVHRSENSIKVSDVVLLHTAEKANRALLHRAIETDALPESWRAHFAKKLAALGKA